MNTAAVSLMIAAAVVALVDWYAVGRHHRRLEWIAKPAVLLLLILAAGVIDPFDEAVRWWMVVGLAFGLLGDALLLSERAFVGGLAAFLIGHLYYVIAFLLAGDLSATAMIFALAGVLIAAVLVGRPLLKGAAQTSRGLAVAVGLYMLVISAMLVLGVGTVSLLAIAGVILFYLSDSLLGWNRFVAPLPGGRLSVIVSYHSAQALLVLWLAA